MQLKQVIDKLLDVFALFGCIFAVIMIIVMLKYSLNYWIPTFQATQTLEAKMFWTGLLIAIVWTSGQVFSGFINEFAKAYRSLFNAKDIRRKK